MRTVIFALSRRHPSPLLGFLGFLAFMSAFAVLWCLSRDSLSTWIPQAILPADPLVVDRIWLTAGAVPVVLTVLGWAADQRHRLEPQPTIVHPGADWFGLAILAVLVIWISLIATPLWSGFRWAPLIAGVVLLPVFIVTDWRRGVLDAFFGKREDPTNEPWS